MSLRRSYPPRGVPSPASGAPELRPSRWLSFPLPSAHRSARRDTRPDGVPGCLHSPCPLLPTVCSVPSSPTKGVGPARAQSSRYDVHIQVQLRVAFAVPGAGRRGRAGHQHQGAALRGSVEAAVREIVGQVVPAVSCVPRVLGDLPSLPHPGRELGASSGPLPLI